MSDAAPVEQLDPFSQVFIQVSDGSKHYAPVIDPTFGLLLVPGSGKLYVWRGGKTYVSEVADPSAASAATTGETINIQINSKSFTIPLNAAPPPDAEFAGAVLLCGPIDIPT